MDSVFIGRALVPPFDISRPLLKCPPWSTILSEIDLNQAPQAFMISGVGFTNPKCRYTNFFTFLSLLMCVLEGLPARGVWPTLFLLALLFLFHASRDFDAVSRQGIRPETLKIASQIIQPFALDRIQATIALRLDVDQARGLEHLQVLRHGRPAHRLAFRQLTHCFGLLAQSLEYVPAGRICQCCKSFCVSHGLL